MLIKKQFSPKQNHSKSDLKSHSKNNLKNDLKRNRRKLGILPWVFTSFLFLGSFLWIFLYLGFFEVPYYSAFASEAINLSTKSPESLIKNTDYKSLNSAKISGNSLKQSALDKTLELTPLSKTNKATPEELILLEDSNIQCQLRHIQNRPREINTYVDVEIQDWWIASSNCQSRPLFALQVVRTSQQNLKVLEGRNNPNNIFLLKEPNIYMVAYTYKNRSLRPSFKLDLFKHKQKLTDSLESNLKFAPSESIDSYRDQKYTYYLLGECRGKSECKILAVNNFDGKIEFVEDYLTSQLQSLSKKARVKISRKQNLKNNLILTLEDQVAGSKQDSKQKVYIIILFDKQSGEAKKPKKLNLDNSKDNKLLKYF